MEIAATGLFRAKWTSRIHNEWIIALSRNRPELVGKLERTRALMDAAILDCIVEGYEDFIPSIECPDPNDRHVIAAAIKADCSQLVTANLKHFPAGLVSKYGIEAIHSDDFVLLQFGRDQATVMAAARRCRLRLRAPAKSVEDYLQTLEIQGLRKTAAKLAKQPSVL